MNDLYEAYIKSHEEPAWVWYVVYADGSTDVFSSIETTLEQLWEHLDKEKELVKIEKKEVRRFVISNERDE